MPGSVLFKAPALAEEWKRLHPEVREVVEALALWCERSDFPSPVVTTVLRTPAQQEALYWRSYVRAGMPEATARTQARAKPSWHLWGCAVDLRSKHYTEAQLQRVMDWLRGRVTAPGPWELLHHDIGAGSHFHLGRRDFDWRNRFNLNVA